MDWKTALEMLVLAVRRSSQAVVAGRIGISNATLSRILTSDGKREPVGVVREKIFEWAEHQSAARPTTRGRTAQPSDAPREESSTQPSLERIAGYTELLGDLLARATEAQQRILDGLNAHVTADANVERPPSVRAVAEAATPYASVPNRADSLKDWSTAEIIAGLRAANRLDEVVEASHESDDARQAS